MKISTARNSIKRALSVGLISFEEAKRFQTRLSEIQRSNRHWSQKYRLYAIWAVSGCVEQ